MARPEGDAGFSLVELLLVVVLLGVLVQIAIPNYLAITQRARAVDLLARVDVVEEAAARYQSDEYLWPSEADAGVVPPGLDGYLPDGFRFTGEDWRLDWENIPVPGGLPGDPTTDRIVGVGVVTENERLARALVAVYGSSGWYSVGDAYVFVLDR